MTMLLVHFDVFECCSEERPEDAKKLRDQTWLDSVFLSVCLCFVLTTAGLYAKGQPQFVFVFMFGVEY